MTINMTNGRFVKIDSTADPERGVGSYSVELVIIDRDDREKVLRFSVEHGLQLALSIQVAAGEAAALEREAGKRS